MDTWLYILYSLLDIGVNGRIGVGEAGGRDVELDDPGATSLDVEDAEPEGGGPVAAPPFRASMEPII
jgi:hypothetical protein